MKEAPKYSKLQYFFWLISGSEISSLKECPSEFNRHANIGMMILMTSLFAGFTAFVAGRTFATDNLLGVILFSLVWALIIFTIDRSMINSIKRDPTKKQQPFWPYFLPRLILAFILAFFMSIPLDHIVFQEKIKRELNENNQQNWLKRQRELTSGYSIDQRDSNLIVLSSQADLLRAQLAQDCPDPDYQEAAALFAQCQPEIISLDNVYRRKVRERKAYYDVLIEQRRQQNLLRPDSMKLPVLPPVDDTWRVYKRESNLAQRNLNDKQAECQGYKDTAESIYNAWESKLKTDLAEKDSTYNKEQKDLLVDKDSIKIKANIYRADIDAMEGFDTQFAALFLMPNWGVQVLKWLIFFALLVIEILPAYLKLKTPISQYDWKLYEIDQISANNTKSRIGSEQDLSNRNEAYRAEKEFELNRKVIDKMAEIELKIASEAIDLWEKETRKSMKEEAKSKPGDD